MNKALHGTIHDPGECMFPGWFLDCLAHRPYGLLTSVLFLKENSRIALWVTICSPTKADSAYPNVYSCLTIDLERPFTIFGN